MLYATTRLTGAEPLPLTLNEIWVSVAENPVLGVALKAMKSLVSANVLVVFQAELEYKLAPLSAVRPVRVIVVADMLVSFENTACSVVVPVLPVMS